MALKPIDVRVQEAELVLIFESMKLNNVQWSRNYPNGNGEGQCYPGSHELLVKMWFDNKEKPIKQYSSNCHCFTSIVYQ